MPGASFVRENDWEVNGMEGEQVIKLTDLPVRTDRTDILRMMELREDSPVYEEVLEEYEDMKEELEAMCTPAVLIRFGTIPDSGERAAFVLSTVGGKLGEYSTRQFQSGDCLKGMIADSAADSMLFHLEEPMMEALKQECALRGVGISRRMEAPVDMPMERQKLIFEKTHAMEELGMGLSSGYMFRPVKSQGILFLLTEDPKVFHAQHDCSKCPRLDCPLRQEPSVHMKVREKETIREIAIKQGQSVLEALTQADRYFEAVCGGNGHCGKCGVRLLEGNLAVTPEDREVFSSEELAAGWRLSCRAYPDGDLTIELSQERADMYEAVIQFEGEAPMRPESGAEMCEAGETSCGGRMKASALGYGIAVDIGTTTIAMQLIDRKSGSAAASGSRINRQRRYGADVISRIQASCDGRSGELQQSIREDLRAGMEDLLEKAGISWESVGSAAIAGNTTMIHLLMGYDCSGLGVYPFTPVNTDLIESDLHDLVSDGLPRVPTAVLPGISAYVGGDIVSGIVCCGMDQSEKISVLVDLGTNGEMALGNREHILSASTAAGPAFEGGNIQWGTGSVPGAVSRVTISGGDVSVETIAGAAPNGICGTGVVETVSELVRNEIVDETGLLDEEYFEAGFPLAKTEDGRQIVFTQQDVREIQLAKAAVRAGLETLLLRFGIAAEDVDTLYIAGGFGFQLDVQKASMIGMLPPALAAKAKAAGNTSLGGAVRYLTDPMARGRMERLARATEELNLSGDADFNRIYMEQMMFAEE